MKTLKILSFTAFVLILALVFSVTNFGESSTDSTTISGYDIGDNATDFSLKNVNGKMVSLSDYEKPRDI